MALGKFAAQSLLKTTEPITRLRGRVFNYRGASLDSDLPSRLSSAQPSCQARGLGRHEEGAGHSARRRLGARVARRLVSVAVPVPALDLLTYSLPDALTAAATGARVVVPLGRRTLTGVVMGEAEPPAPDVELRDVIEVLDEHPFLPPDVLRALGMGRGLLPGRSGSDACPRRCRRTR